MNSFTNILSGLLPPQHESDDDLDEFYDATREGSSNLSHRKRHRGSMRGHKVVDRRRSEGHERLYRDYFSTPCIYECFFRRRFRMNRRLFLRILKDVEDFDPYFTQKKDALGVLGLSSLQKVTAAFRILAYGSPADSIDEYVRIAESTAIQSLRRFIKAIIAIYGEQYLRRPNNNDIARLLAIGEERGFPGMLGSIDCMHWKWKNCPTAWQGMYTGHCHDPTIILEVVASRDLWIWHAFFGLPGSLNDINVLDRSPIFDVNLPVKFTVNGHEYLQGYYLADGIYPNWPVFMKTIPCPQGRKKFFFAAPQESARKDVERAFGVLQSRFAIVRGPARFWDEQTLSDIMKACVLMHNMIIEDEGDSNIDFDENESIPPIEIAHTNTEEKIDFIQSHHNRRNSVLHSQLQSDLIEHQWELHGHE